MNEVQRGKKGEKIEAPFNEAGYKEIFAMAGLEYPEEEVQANLKSMKKEDLHKRAKIQIEKTSRIVALGEKYKVRDQRLKRIFPYFLEDEADHPENAEKNRQFVEELNTPEGAQLFVNRLTKMFMDQDLNELVATDMKDMTEIFLKEPAKYSVLFAVMDLYNGVHTAKDPMFTVDPEIEKAIKEKMVPLQSGGAFLSAARLMASDEWALVDTDVMQNYDDVTAFVGQIWGNIGNVKDITAIDELNVITNEYYNYYGSLLDKPTWEKMRDKGLLNDGLKYTLDGKELERKDVQNQKDRLDDIVAAPAENYVNIKRRVDEQVTLSDYLGQMHKSQKAIWGKGSPEFQNLMDAIEDYQKACAEDSSKGIKGSKVNKTMKQLMDLADAYLKIKEGKSLNTNGKIRYEMVQGLKEELTRITKARFSDMINRHYEEAGIKPVSDEEIKKKSEDPENKRLHEQAKEYLAKNKNKELKYEEVKKQYPSKNYPNMDNSLNRFYYYFLDRSGTPAAKEYNEKFMASLNTPEGQQQLVNKAVKTILQTPNEFLLPKNMQEAAKNYMDYPELCDMCWIMCDIAVSINKPDSPFKLDDSIKNALNNKLTYLQGTEYMQQSINFMAREDWAHFDVNIPNEMTNINIGGFFSSDTGMTFDPFQVNFGDGRAHIIETSMVIGSRYELGNLFAGRQQLDNGTKMFENGAEVTYKGEKLKINDALKKVKENGENGLDAMDGIEVSYDEKAAAELNAKINQLDTGMARMSTPQDKQLEAAKQAEEAAKKAEEPAKKAEEAPKAAERPAVDPAKIEAAKAGFSREENEKYEKDRRFMQSRANLLPNGPEKLVSEMAIAAKDSLFEHVGRHRIYTRSTIDMKIMTFQRLLTQDIKFGEGKIAQAMEARGITTPKQAEAFIDAFNMGPAMKNFENTVMIHRTGEGQIAVTDDCKAQMKAFAVGDGAADIAHQCTQSIKAVNKAMADKRYQEALAKNKGLEKAADKLPGGPGIGK